MTATMPTHTREYAILRRAMRPRGKTMTVSAAKALLQVKLDESDHARLHELSQKNQQAELTTDEEAELQSYLHIGMLIDLMQAQARLSLKKSSAGQ